MKKTSTQAVPLRLTQLAVALGLAFAMPAVMAMSGSLYGEKQGSNYVISVGKDGKVVTGKSGSYTGESAAGQDVNDFISLIGRDGTDTGDDSLETATGGKVTIKGGSIDGAVYGGASYKGAVKNNVEISNATIKDDRSSGNVYGGFAIRSDATGNEVTVDKATIDGDVYGGFVTVRAMVRQAASLGSGGSTDAQALKASGNTVTIDGTKKKVTIDGNVYGGLSADATEVYKRGCPR